MTSSPDTTKKGHKEPLVKAGETVPPQESSQQPAPPVEESAKDAAATLEENVGHLVPLSIKKDIA